jgi:hypothetical protein
MAKRKVTNKRLPLYCKRHKPSGLIYYYRPNHPSLHIPYEPGTVEFQAAYDMAERCARGWVKRIRRAHRQFEDDIKLAGARKA